MCDAVVARIVTEHSKYKGVIVNTTDMRKLKAWVGRKINDIVDFLIFRMQQIGEECVKIAREPHANDYNDITGNLRSSIGYVILYNGKVVFGGESKQISGKHGDGAQGVEQGQKVLKTLQGNYPTGVVLIVCAGMSYAAYVENIRHKDVLTCAELVAKDLMRQLLHGVVE